MESLVNIDGLTEVANNMLNKISTATKMVITRETPEKIAIKTYIEDIQESSYDPITKAALISNAKKIIKEYTNQVNIVEKARSMVSNGDHIEEVSNDWIAAFMDKARLVSDEDFQFMWAKILAGEMEKPGAYSLRTLDVIKNFSKAEAELFQKVTQFVVISDGSYVVPSDDSIINRYGLTFSDFLWLEECGLFSGRSLFLTLSADENLAGTIYNSNVVGILHYKENAKNSIRLGIHMLSEAGRELLQVIDVEPNRSFFVDILNKIKKDNKNACFTAHNVLKIHDNGRIEYYPTDLLEEK